ncbi:MAG: hypothetical protein J6T96_04990, partial [Bacteroidales bacterium]|nr:hypothetical protein [Bacteroidales bacterium]
MDVVDDEDVEHLVEMDEVVASVVAAGVGILGLEFAGIWAFAIFVLSYIPTIGAIVGCTMPILFAAISGATFNQIVL